MINRVKGEAALALSDGQQFTLVLDFEALVQAEEVYGKPAARLMIDASAGFIGALRALLFGALRRYHGDLTMAAVTAIFEADAAAVEKAIEAAADAALPEATEGRKPGKAQSPTGPTGPNSGGNGAKPGLTPTHSGAAPREALP